jgi:tRNA threonylcarbamoyladenosine biosynthesis protein TsaB
LNIIALDTAAPVLSVALASENGLWYTETDSGLRHSENLMDMADALMRRAGMRPSDLDAAACMQGPGSFTGIRIGFAAALGLSLSLDIPLAPVPTLDCMALPWARWPGTVLPVMDAKKKRFFAALYRGNERISEYMDAEASRIAALLPPGDQILLTGPGAPLLAPLLAGKELFTDPGCTRGKAKELLEIAKKNDIFNNKRGVFSGPLYLRKSDAELTS